MGTIHRKILADIQNNSLRFFGKYSFSRVNVVSGETYSDCAVVVYGAANTVIKVTSPDLSGIVDGNGNTAELPYTVSLGDTGSATFSIMTEGTILVGGQYDAISSISFSNANKYIMHSEINDFLTKEGGVGSISRINFNNTHIKGEIKGFSACFSGVTEVYLSATDLEENWISKIAELTAINTVAINNTTYNQDITDFVSKQVSLGRTVSFSSPITFSGVGRLRFNGLQMNGSYGTVAFESNSRIAVYLDGTFANSEWTKVYAMGATAEELSAWRQAGKTVIEVN